MKTSINYKKTAHIILGGAIGNLAIWYNFLLYGYLAFVISPLFFPTQNKCLSLMLTFTVFSLSFFARPFGGILFGWIGDHYGRQRALFFSLILMAIPTFFIGCLPTYHHIGIASPTLLCIFRTLQGLSAGGEDTGAAIYLAEHAPTKRRTLWVSTVPATAAIGILISSAAALWIVNHFTHTQLFSWGWRVGFWSGALLCLVSLSLRLKLPETPYFQKIQIEAGTNRFPVLFLIKDPQALRGCLLVFCLASAWGVLYQILFIWMPTYLMHAQQVSNTTALQINTFFMLCFTGLILVFGYIADYISRRLLLTLTCSTLLIFAYPLFILLASGSLWQIYFAMGVLTLLFSIFIPAAFVCMLEAFKTQARYTGLSLGFNLGLAIFGGTSPLILTGLIHLTHNMLSPALYFMLFVAVGLFSALLFHNQRGKRLSS